MLSCLVGTLTLLEPIFAFFLPGAVGHQSRSQSSQWRPLVCGAHCLPGFSQKPSGESTRPNVALMNSSSVNLLKQKLNPKCMELKDEDDYVDIAALFIDLSVLKLNEPVFAVFAELLVLHWDFVFSAVSEISFMFNFCLYHFGLLLFCFLNFFLVLLSVCCNNLKLFIFFASTQVKIKLWKVHVKSWRLKIALEEKNCL